MMLCFDRRPEALGRVIGLPYAGASPAWLRTWSRDLPATVELRAGVYPGRSDPVPPDRIEDAMPAMMAAAEPLLDRPYVIYGHSVGAWVGFEMVRAIARSGLPMPRALVVSGRQAPSCTPRLAPITHLPDSEFVEAVAERYRAMPRVVLDDPDLLAMLVPGLRADLRFSENYRFNDHTRIDVPIVAFGGSTDPFTTSGELEAWRTHTSAGTEIHWLPGGHFFVDGPPQRRAVVARIVERVLA